MEEGGQTKTQTSLEGKEGRIRGSPSSAVPRLPPSTILGRSRWLGPWRTHPNAVSLGTFSRERQLVNVITFPESALNASPRVCSKHSQKEKN